MPVNMPHMGTGATPLMFSYLSHAPQPPVRTIHVGTHLVRSAAADKRSASTALAGTILSVQILVQGLVLFLNRQPLFF